MAKKDKYELEWEKIRTGQGQEYLQGGVIGNAKGERYYAGTPSVLSNQQEEKKTNFFDNWINSGAFKDGYQFGDITKSIGSTAGDIGLNVVEGIMSMGEGLGDLANYGIANIQDYLGYKDQAKERRQQASENATSLTMNWLKNKIGINENSLSGDKIDNIGRAVGNAMTIWATAGLGEYANLGKVGSSVLTNGELFASSMGSGMSEAYQSGATDDEALKYGIISALAETGSEMMFGGLGRGLNTIGVGKGLSEADDILAKKVASKFKTKLAKNLSEYVVKSGAEGVEEVVSGVLQGFGKYYTYQKDKDLGQIMKDEDLLDSFIAGAVSSGIMQSSGFVKSIKANRDFITNLTDVEQRKVDERTSDRVAELQKQGKKVTDKEISKIAEEEKDKMLDLLINIEYFRDKSMSYYQTLDNQSRMLYNDLVNDISQLSFDTGIAVDFEPEQQELTRWDGNTLVINPSMTTEPIKTLLLKGMGYKLLSNDSREAILSYSKEIKSYEPLKQQLMKQGLDETSAESEIISLTLNDILSNVNKIKKLDDNTYKEVRRIVDNIARKYNRDTKDNLFLQQSMANLNNVKGIKNETMANPYTPDVSKYKGLARNTVINAQESNLLNNSRQTQRIMDVASKVSEHINKEFEFTNNERLDKLYKKLIKDGKIEKGETINGYMDDGKIVVNIDSPEAINFIIGHEVSHAIRNSKNWDDLKNTLIDLAEERKDYKKFADRIKDVYPNMSNEELNEELVSDLIGKYLFTDQEFINRVSKNKNVVDKIIDTLKNIVNDIKDIFGINSREQQLLNKAIKAYEKAYNDNYEQNKGFKLSLSEQNKEGNVTDNKGRKLTKGQQKYFGKSKVVDENGNLMTVYHTTTEPLVQFNEFNPVGTYDYRFRDQVVNYYSDDKIMSGSYASRHTDYGSVQSYNMADPSKLNSIDEARKWIEENRFAGLIPYDYELSEKSEDGYIRLKLYNWDSGNKILEQNYNSDETLLKNVREDIQKVIKPVMHNIQYEGYLNIKNPYVVDAKGNYWNRVKSDIEGYISDFINKINQNPELKDRAIKLAKESEKEYYKYLKSDSKRTYYLLQEMKYDIQGNVEEIINYASPRNLDYDAVLKKHGKRLLDMYPSKVAEHTPSGNSLLYDFIPENYHGYFTEKLKKIGIDFNKLTIKQYTNMLRESMKDNIKYGSNDSYFSNKIEDVLGKETYKNLVSNGVGKYTLYDIASHNFEENYLSDNYGRIMTTNDVVIQIIKDNVMNNAGYDGVIFKNVIDYGGSAHEDESAHDVYVTFNSNQFKSVENKKPTEDPDWRYSLSKEATEEYGDFNIYGKDIKAEKLIPKTETKVEEKPKVKSQVETKVGEDEYRSTDKLPGTTKPGTYIEPSTPIKQFTKKAKKFVEQITNQNIFSKELSKNYTSFVDKLHPIQELADVSGNNQLYAKFNNRGMSNGKGQYQIGTAQTDINGNVIGKSINNIFKPVEDAGLTTEFDDYLAHRLNIERYDKVPVWDESVTPKISKQIVKEYENKYSQFKEWAEDVYTFNDNQLQKMIDGGLAKENARDWLYNNYVTISREIGPSTNPLLVNSKGVGVNSPIRKAKGSNLAIRPMKEAMARQALLTERAIADNIAGQELLNVLGGTVGKTKTLLTQAMEGENNALVQNPDGTYNYTVYKDGVPVTMQVTKEVADAIKPSTTKEWESLAPFKAIRGISGLQRGLLTDKNPLFIFTNFFKDIGDAPLNSKFSAGEMYANYPKAVSMMIKNSPEWQKYVANGGLANTYFETKSGEFVKSQNKFVRGIQTINELVEQAPRFTEYLNTLAHGGTLQEALYNSAEVTTNFARGGEITKILNRNGFNFLNASVQGFDKQIRNFTRQPGAKGYIQLLTKVALLGVAPALINNFLLDDDDDYVELPDYVKDNYYLFKTSDNQFVRIPKGRVMSIFGTTARHLVEIGKGNENLKDLVKDTGEQILNNVAPNNPLENNILSPLISVANNKSWSGSKIVSTTLENYPDAYQYDEKTTSLAKWLGKTFNYSPKKIDYLLDQYTGGIGDVVMPIMTPYAESNTDNVVKNALIAPFVSKFTVDSTISNKYVNQYYDVKNELQKEVKTYNSIEDSEEAFVKSLQYKYLDKVGNDISALYAEKKQIQNSDLSTSEKYQQARLIQRQIDDLAKFAMQDYQTGYYTDAYATIGDKEFYTTMKNGKLVWSEVDDKIKAKQEEYAQKYDMSPEDYFSMDGLTQSTIAGSNVYAYNEINDKLKKIRDNTSNDKEETFEYINSLDMSLPQKAMYLRTYYKSFNDYNTDIFNYVNSLDIINDQKKAILINLGFDYDKNTGTFSWK